MDFKNAVLLSMGWDSASKTGIKITPGNRFRCLVLYNKRREDGRCFILGSYSECDPAGNMSQDPELPGPNKSGDVSITAPAPTWTAGIHVLHGGMIRIMSHPLLKMLFNVINQKVYLMARSLNFQTLGGVVDWENTKDGCNLNITCKSEAKETQRINISIGKKADIVKLSVNDGTEASKEISSLHVGKDGKMDFSLNPSDVTKAVSVSVDPAGKITIVTPKSELGAAGATDPMVKGNELINLLVSHTHPCFSPSPQLVNLPQALSQKHTLDK